MSSKESQIFMLSSRIRIHARYQSCQAKLAKLHSLYIHSRKRISKLCFSFCPAIAIATVWRRRKQFGLVKVQLPEQVLLTLRRKKLGLYTVCVALSKADPDSGSSRMLTVLNTIALKVSTVSMGCHVGKNKTERNKNKAFCSIYAC